MENVIGIAFVTLAAAQFLGIVVYLVNAGRLLQRLKASHAAVHESLGSPSLVAKNTLRTNLLFLRWIWHRDFETLDDQGSVALSRRVRAFLIWLIGGFAVLIALFFVLFTTP